MLSIHGTFRKNVIEFVAAVCLPHSFFVGMIHQEGRNEKPCFPTFRLLPPRRSKAARGANSVWYPGYPGTRVRLYYAAQMQKGEQTVHCIPGTQVPRYPDTRVRLTRRRSNAKRGAISVW